MSCAVLAGFSGHGNSSYHIIPLLKKENVQKSFHFLKVNINSSCSLKKIFYYILSQGWGNILKNENAMKYRNKMLSSVWYVFLVEFYVLTYHIYIYHLHISLTLISYILAYHTHLYHIYLPIIYTYIIIIIIIMHAISTDISDPLSPPLPNVHCFWHVLRATSRIGTELLYVGSSWSTCLCSSMWRGPQEYITYELVPTSPTVSRMSGSSNFDSFRDGW